MTERRPSDPISKGARARSTILARAVAYTVVIALGALAVAFTPRLPDRQPVTAALAAAPKLPVWLQRTDTLARGETLSALLQRVGVRGADAVALLRSATALDERRVPAGLTLTARSLDTDSVPSEVVFHLAIDRLLKLTRTDSGWVSVEEKLPWKIDTVGVAGKVMSSLHQALSGDETSGLPASVRDELTWAVADVYEYRVDMSRDLQPDDQVRVLVERHQGPRGAVRIGPILAATLTVGGSEIQAIRHEPPSGRAQYYDQTGRSMRAAFLRAPLQFRRISSVYGMRKHPILGVWRQHAGTDYAASQGTPVRSIGDGVVIYAGRRGGYGNVVEVRHRNGFVSRYGHLRGFARGARRGSAVAIGQTIGYVGMTGLATAPHLHFEVLVGGRQKNPRVALAMKGGEPLPASQRDAFDRTRGELLALLDAASDVQRLASRE